MVHNKPENQWSCNERCLTEFKTKMEKKPCIAIANHPMDVPAGREPLVPFFDGVVNFPLRDLIWVIRKFANTLDRRWAILLQIKTPRAHRRCEILRNTRATIKQPAEGAKFWNMGVRYTKIASIVFKSDTRTVDDVIIPWHSPPLWSSMVIILGYPPIDDVIDIWTTSNWVWRILRSLCWKFANHLMDVAAGREPMVPVDDRVLLVFEEALLLREVTTGVVMNVVNFSLRELIWVIYNIHKQTRKAVGNFCSNLWKFKIYSWFS